MARMLGRVHGHDEIADYYCCRKCTPGAKVRGRRAQRAAEKQRWKRESERTRA